jgi:ectoine hydroxylase-related dioxygenase (phytanoyl-CoA dioxygenase family)
MRVLSQADWDFWQKNGYVIIHDAVPPENIKALVDTIWDFMGMDRSNPDTWYTEPSNEHGTHVFRAGGMVEMYQHQAMWDNRQHPRVYGAFADIWGTDKLWVSMDRVNLNVPARAGTKFGGFIHWDIDTTQKPPPFMVQGVLSLVDTTAEQGGLQVIPGFHNIFEEWVKTQPADRDPWHPDITGFEVVPVITKAGDLVIWHSLLPHGTRRNDSNRPRIAQYITMSPAEEDNEAARAERIAMWRDRLSPEGEAFPGDPRKIEVLQNKTAELTPLGRKLLGLDRWEMPETAT